MVLNTLYNKGIHGIAVPMLEEVVQMSEVRMPLVHFKQKLIEVFSDDPEVRQAAEADDFVAIYELLFPYSKWPNGGRWLGRRGAPLVTPQWLLDADSSALGRKRRDALLRKYAEAEWMVGWLRQECMSRKLKLKWPSLLKGDGDEGYLPTAV